MKENLLQMKDRLRQYIEAERITVEQIERKNLCSKGSIHRFLREDGSFSIGNLQRLSESCPNLSIEWLVTGRGSMVYSESKAESQVSSDVLIDLNNQLLESKKAVIQALEARIRTQEDYIKLLTEKYLTGLDQLLEHNRKQDATASIIMENMKKLKTT